ncbi:MAG: hypothetical protein JWO67_153 [Streptosporangiaceae bacterium]|nr:hypothetical protein [Streptosporangiaceae bacterium]
MKGKTPHRNIRIADSVWNPAKEIAEAEGSNVTAVIDAALRRYVARHRTKGKSGSE